MKVSFFSLFCFSRVTKLPLALISSSHLSRNSLISRQATLLPFNRINNQLASRLPPIQGPKCKSFFFSIGKWTCPLGHGIERRYEGINLLCGAINFKNSFKANFKSILKIVSKLISNQFQNPF